MDPATSPPVDQLLRRQTILAVECLLRIMHKAVECYGEDLGSITVYAAVVCASSSAAMRNPKVLAEIGDDPLPDRYHRPVSRRAIAASTGLPRETVRRKIAQLVEQGLLIDEDGGVRTRTDVLHERRNLEFVRTLLREIEKGAASLERAAVAPKTRPKAAPRPAAAQQASDDGRLTLHRSNALGSARNFREGPS